MKRLSVLCLVVLLNVSKPVTAQIPSLVVPDFTFFKLDDTPFSYKHMLPHRPSLFSFFDVTCSHCQSAMKMLSSNYQQLKESGVYLVTMDRKDAVLKFLKVYGPNFLNKQNVFILQDLRQEFIPKFQPVKYPSVFLYDEHRKLVVYENDDKKMLMLLKRVKGLQQ